MDIRHSNETRTKKNTRLSTDERGYKINIKRSVDAAKSFHCFANTSDVSRFSRAVCAPRTELRNFKADNVAKPIHQFCLAPVFQKATANEIIESCKKENGM